MTGRPEPSLKLPEDEAVACEGGCYRLTLFVNGASDLSARAVAQAAQLCESHLAGRYRLSVVDVHDDPDAVVGNRVFATPTLVKNRPPPVRRVVGDLSDTDRVLVALGLPVTEDISNALS